MPNQGENHLYDLDDEDVRSSYQELKETKRPETLGRDNLSNSHIVSEVEDHMDDDENPLVVVERAAQTYLGCSSRTQKNWF